MTIQQMMDKKKEYGYSNSKIAELSGVPIGTVQKIFSGETKSPRYETIQLLSSVFDEAYNEVHKEAAFRYNVASKQRLKSSYEEKTLEDYLALPEGARIELIDGKFYDIAAPTMIHQSISLELGYLFKTHVEKNKGSCITFVAPTDVQIDMDDRTIVQPDVFVVCDRNKITRARLVGAPDFIVEVLSPSNFMMDLVIKLAKYKNAGVREYWVVLPDDKAVIVYEFEKSDIPVQYSFEDTVPVGIWNGECRIDFKKIYEKIEFMY